MNKSKKKLSTGETIWYSVCGALGLWGLTYTILGLVANNLAIPTKNNELLKASLEIKRLFGLDFFGWGLIILAIAALGAVICLVALAKNTDRDFEKSQRRAARLARNSSGEEVVDVKVEE